MTGTTDFEHKPEQHKPENHGPMEVTSRRRPYSTPRLTVLGDIRSMTLGPTSGTGESGNEFTLRL